MPKIKSNYPSLSALRAALILYCDKREMPPRADTSENKYLELLAAHLEKDKIIKGASRNLVLKLLGQPSQASPELTDAIDPAKLESLAKIVVDDWKLEERAHSKANGFYWNYFKEKLFPLPDHLAHLQDYRYYRFLSTEDKNLLDGYVQRKMDEYGIDPNTVTYIVYVWSHVDHYVRTALLQINLKRKFSTYTIFSKDKDGLIIKSVMRSDLEGGFFRKTNSTFFISFADENSGNIVRANFQIAIHEIGFLNLRYLKGMLSFSAFNISTPTACPVILHRQDNYQIALNINSNNLKDVLQPEILQPIVFDSINKRIEITDQSLETIEKLGTYKIYKTLYQAQGAYLIFFVSSTDYLDKIDQVTMGNGFIEPTGFVTYNFPSSSKIHAYVDNSNYLGEDALTIRDFVETGMVESKFTQCLKVKKDKWTNKVLLLYGGYLGHFQTTPLVGKILFIKLDDVTDKDGFDRKIHENVMTKEQARNYKFKETDINLSDYLDLKG